MDGCSLRDRKIRIGRRTSPHRLNTRNSMSSFSNSGSPSKSMSSLRSHSGPAIRSETSDRLQQVVWQERRSYRAISRSGAMGSDQDLGLEIVSLDALAVCRPHGAAGCRRSSGGWSGRSARRPDPPGRSTGLWTGRPGCGVLSQSAACEPVAGVCAGWRTNRSARRTRRSHRTRPLPRPSSGPSAADRVPPQSLHSRPSRSCPGHDQEVSQA